MPCKGQSGDIGNVQSPSTLTMFAQSVMQQQPFPGFAQILETEVCSNGNDFWMLIGCGYMPARPAADIQHLLAWFQPGYFKINGNHE